MNLRRLFPLLAVAASLTATAPAPVSATTEGRLRVELLVDGRPMREYRDRGTTYVEAQRGREYSVRLTNLENVRVAVALAVDGRNSIDGRRTSAADARKWILDPWQSMTVSGWQVGESRARRFFFTTEDRSYADWLGDTRHVGVIEAVAFRERPRPQVWSDRDDRGPWGRDRRGLEGERAEAQAGARSGNEAPSAAQSAPSASGSTSSARAKASTRADSRDHAASEEAATGIGRDMRNEVVRVSFEHDAVAASSVRIRYEFREGLERLGIIARHADEDHLRRREHASGFDGGSWAPEPPWR